MSATTVLRRLAVAAAAGVAAVWLYVLVAGAVGAVFGGAAPPWVWPWEAIGTLARLPGSMDAPRQAWPTAARDALPGRSLLGIALLLTAMVAFGGVLALGGIIGGRRRGHTGRAGQGTKAGARFAQAGDLRRLHVRGPESGRVILGRHGRQLLAAEPRASTLVIAPSQSGKTTGLAVPAILEWNGPVLATSVKGDLTHDTYAARAAMGETRIFDPTSSTGLPTSSWSPIAAADSWEAARRVASRLLEVGAGRSGSPEDAFWRPAGARFLAPLLLAAHLDRRTMADVLRWIAAGIEDPEVTDALQGDPRAPAQALEAVQSVWDAEPRFRSSVVQTIATALDPFAEPQVAAAAGDAPDAIAADWLLDGQRTLYLTAPAHDQRRLRGMFTALIGEVLVAAFDRATRTGKPLDPPLLVVLDEAANVAPMGNLDEIASTAPGQGVQLLTVLQNMSQAQERWGREKAETIVANHRARLFGTGIADGTTLEYLRKIGGDEALVKQSTTKDRGELIELGSRTTSTEYRPLAAPDRVRQAAGNSALLIYGNLPPAWVSLRPWYEDRDLRRRVEQPEQAASA